MNGVFVRIPIICIYDLDKGGQYESADYDCIITRIYVCEIENFIEQLKIKLENFISSEIIELLHLMFPKCSSNEKYIITGWVEF